MIGGNAQICEVLQKTVGIVMGESVMLKRYLVGNTTLRYVWARETKKKNGWSNSENVST